MILGFLFGLAGPALAASASVVPDTSAGQQAQAVLASLAQDHAARAALVRERFTSKALTDTPAEQWVVFLDRLAEQSGGLDPVVVLPESSENFVVMDMRARRRDDRFARFYLSVSGHPEPGRISDVGVLAIRDPARAAGDAWPQGRLANADLVRAIDARARRLADEDLLSGVVLVAKRDRVVYLSAFNQADRAFAVPNRKDTRFNLGSMPKMFTAVAIGQLLDAGKLGLEDTVAKWLPDFPDRDKAGKITIRHLLTHGSGLGDFFGEEYARDRRRYLTHTSYFPLVAREPLAFEPGQGFRYSNGGFALLGAIVERASGEDYDAYLRAHVFAPAGMTASGNFDLDDPVHNRATGYARPMDDPLGVEPRRSNIMTIAYRGNGAGGGYATAEDLLRFVRALRESRLLKPETTELFTTPKVDFPGTPHPEKYAYGFGVGECGGKRTIGHAGGGPNSGVSSTLYAFADGSWTIAVLTNYDPPVGDDFAWGLCEFLARQ